jgi:hypothetical protein
MSCLRRVFDGGASAPRGAAGVDGEGGRGVVGERIGIGEVARSERVDKRAHRAGGLESREPLL